MAVSFSYFFHIFFGGGWKDKRTNFSISAFKQVPKAKTSVDVYEIDVASIAAVKRTKQLCVMHVPLLQSAKKKKKKKKKKK